MRTQGSVWAAAPVNTGEKGRGDMKRQGAKTFMEKIHQRDPVTDAQRLWNSFSTLSNCCSLRGSTHPASSASRAARGRGASKKPADLWGPFSAASESPCRTTVFYTLLCPSPPWLASSQGKCWGSGWARDSPWGKSTQSLVGRQTFTQPSGKSHPALEHRLWSRQPPPKDTPLLLGHPAVALDPSKAWLPRHFKTGFLPACDGTPSSEPSRFSNTKNALQSVDGLMRTAHQGSPKTHRSPLGSLPAAVSQGSTRRSTPRSRSLAAFETPVQQVSHKILGRIKAAGTYARNAPSPERAEHGSRAGARLPRLPARHSKLCSQIPNCSSSRLIPLQPSTALCS